MSWLDALGQDVPSYGVGAKNTSCDWFSTDDILAKVIAGERTNDIAAALGVSKDKIVRYLSKRVPDEWKEAQVIRALRHRAEARHALAASRLTGFRSATRKLASALWQLKQVCLRVYGDAKPPDHLVARISQK